MVVVVVMVKRDKKKCGDAEECEREVTVQWANAGGAGGDDWTPLNDR